MTTTLNKPETDPEAGAQRAVVRSTTQGLRELRPVRKDWRSFVFMSHSRLADALPSYRSRMERLIASTCETVLKGAPAAPECNWAVHGLRLVDCAEESLRVGRAELGWKCLHEAERMELHGLSLLASRGVTEPLRVRGRSIAFEAGRKLRGWRKATVEDLLAPGKDPEWVPDVCRLTESHYILTESFANTYHVLRAQRWQVGVLAATAMAALGTWWFGVGPAVLSARIAAASEVTAGVSRFPVGLLPSVVLFGIIGATVSGMAALIRTEPDTIPKQLTAWTGSMARIVVGAIAALVIFLALESTVLEGADSRLILLQSFVAGFSERLLSAAVKNAGG